MMPLQEIEFHTTEQWQPACALVNYLSEGGLEWIVDQCNTCRRIALINLGQGGWKGKVNSKFNLNCLKFDNMPAQINKY